MDMVQQLLFPQSHSGVSHALVAVAMMIAVAVPLWLARVRTAHWIGAALAVGFYWGREKRDFEGRLLRPAGEVWNQGIFPWEWTAKSIHDFVWPLVAVLAVALVFEAVRRRMTRYAPATISTWWRIVRQTSQ
jgi:hypothetical protein